MKKFYNQLSSVIELKELEKEALAAGTHAIGFTKKGNLYKWDDELKKPTTISLEEAQEILGVDAEVFAKLISTQGKYKIPEVTEVEEVTDELIEAVQESTVPEETTNDETLENLKTQVKEVLVITGDAVSIEEKLDRIIELLESFILE